MTRSLLASLLALFVGFAYCAESTYPGRPVRFLVPFQPGGGSDIIARAVSVTLAESWRQPVVVENRPGAGGNIGTVLVARSNPDGHTVLVTSSAFSVNPSLYKDAGYDALKDFKPVILSGASPNIVFISASTPVKSLAELIALAKQKPLSFASPGSGTTVHLSGELLFRSLAGLSMTHVPYNGGVAAVNSVLSGDNQVGLTAMPQAMPMVNAGRLRALAVTSPQRSPALPEVPTVAEQGFPGFSFLTWIGFLAPAATPATLVDRINRDIARALQMPEVQKRLVAAGYDPLSNTPAEFAALLQGEVVKWARVVKESGARPD
jgi:tripartite-type tricarboxylate transporter receptor subunit TctC